jgi:hypothetical protein
MVDFMLWMDGKAFLSSISFSLSRILPFGAFQGLTEDYIRVATYNSLWLKILVGVLASVQSGAALVLSFLFGLAVRRRFQIG